MDWLVPLKHRGRSWTDTLNVLGREGNVFVMDNHLAAAWCWAQVLDPAEKYDLFHIDAHLDWQTVQFKHAVKTLQEPLSQMTLAEYLALNFITAHGGPSKTFLWDTYLPLFRSRYRKQMVDWRFCTHEIGTKPKRLAGYRAVKMWDLLDNLSYWLNDSPRRWILNLDLDYFFFENARGRKLRWASPQYVASIGKLLAALQKQGKLAVVTIALSPECCGGWKPAETVMSEFMQALGVPVTLRVGKEP
jgi:hypothetical protein